MTFEFVPYMKSLAVSLKELLHTEEKPHFNRVTSLAALEELLANSRKIEGAQLVVLDKISGRLDDTSNTDNLLDRRVFTFYVFKNVLHGDYDAHETAIRDCLSIARKIESRMFYDKRQGLNGLRLLDRSFYYDTIGPFAQGYFGVMVNFSLTDAAGIVYSPDDWQS